MSFNDNHDQPVLSQFAILWIVHIISKKALDVFCLKHPTARMPLDAWYRLVSTTAFDSFVDVKRAFNSADYVQPFVIFDLAGNNFRLITAIHFNPQKLYILEVFTHAEYDRWSKANRSKKP